jgi:hypothetical protein
VHLRIISSGARHVGIIDHWKLEDCFGVTSNDVMLTVCFVKIDQTVQKEKVENLDTQKTRSFKMFLSRILG